MQIKTKNIESIHVFRVENKICENQVVRIANPVRPGFTPRHLNHVRRSGSSSNSNFCGAGQGLRTEMGRTEEDLLHNRDHSLLSAKEPRTTSMAFRKESRLELYRQSEEEEEEEDNEVVRGLIFT